MKLNPEEDNSRRQVRNYFISVLIFLLIVSCKDSSTDSSFTVPDLSDILFGEYHNLSIPSYVPRGGNPFDTSVTSTNVNDSSRMILRNDFTYLLRIKISSIVVHDGIPELLSYDTLQTGTFQVESPWWDDGNLTWEGTFRFHPANQSNWGMPFSIKTSFGNRLWFENSFYFADSSYVTAMIWS